MGEIFIRVRPATELTFTGERMTGAMQGQIEIEHLHRYFLARDMARGLDVLDIACGEGYGSALLAQVARSVVGVDISAEAVAFANDSYRQDNLSFQTGDGREIPVADDSVDLIVSFETLEHLYDQQRLLAEFRRVLRPGGLLIISTPDREVYSPDGSVPNPHHVRELDQPEFMALLRPAFPSIRLFQQRPMIGSAILPIAPEPGDAPALTFERRAGDTFEANHGLPRALYFLAYCSDQPVQVPVSSLYIETSQIEAREAATQLKIETMRVLGVKHFAELRRVQAELQQSQREQSLLKEALEGTRAHLQQTAKHLRAIQNSTLWRLSQPLRYFLGHFPRLRRLFRGGIKLLWWTVSLQLPRKLTERRIILARLAEEANARALDAARVQSPAIQDAPEAETQETKGISAPHLTSVQIQAQRQALGVAAPAPVLKIAIGVVTYDNGTRVGGLSGQRTACVGANRRHWPAACIGQRAAQHAD